MLCIHASKKISSPSHENEETLRASDCQKTNTPRKTKMSQRRRRIKSALRRISRPQYINFSTCGPGVSAVTTSDNERPKFCEIDDCKTTSQVTTQRKKVRFHPSAKTHDGLTSPQANLERLIIDFFKRNIDILKQMLHQRRHDDLRMLLLNIRQLISRVARSPNGRAPLLNKGGGRGVVIRKKHVPHIIKLYAATAKVYKECVRLVGQAKTEVCASQNNPA